NCNQARAALVFAREQIDRIAGGNLLAAIHGLLRGKRESACACIGDFGLDGVHHVIGSLSRSVHASSRRRAEIGIRVLSCCANSETRNSSSIQRYSSVLGGFKPRSA